MSAYQAYTDEAAGSDYGYGPGEAVPFLDASGELAGPGTSAYETSSSPEGYARTSYAYEGYYSNTYQRDTTASSNNYAVQTEYSYYANGNLYSNDTYTSLHDGGFGYYGGYSDAYYAHGEIGYVYNSESSFDVSDGAAFHAYDEHVQQTFYETGGYTTEIETASSADYDGTYVSGSGEQHVQQSYTDPSGYTTVYQDT